MILEQKFKHKLEKKIEPNAYWKKICNQHNVDFHDLDWTSLQEQEKDFTKQEFSEYVLSEIKKISALDRTEVYALEEPTKTELKTQTEELETQELKKIEKEAEQKELEIISQIKENKTPELDKYYNDLDIYIRVLETTPNINALILIGDAGIGKSTYIKKKFKEENVLLSGHVTAKELYLTYVEHPRSNIIIDDPSSLYSNIDCLGLLLQATQTEPIRTIHWHSSTLKINKKTTFYGKTTLIQNYELNNEILESRCLVKELHFDFGTKIKMLYEFAKIIKCPLEVVDEIKKLKPYGELVAKKISFRTLQKLVAFHNNEQEWKKRVFEVIGVKDSKIKMYDFVLELNNKFSSVKDMEDEFIKKTKLSRATFCNYRNEIGLQRGYKGTWK